MVDAKFLEAYQFSDGLAPVKSDDGWGYIDPTGKMVVSPQFDTAEAFQNGLARVGAFGKEAYITMTGAFVIGERMIAEATATAKRFAGEWVGNSRLPITTSKGGAISSPFSETSVLRGELVGDNSLRLRASSPSGAFGYDLELSSDGASLTGHWRGVGGTTYPVAFTKRIP